MSDLDSIAREVEARSKALAIPVERTPQDPRFVAKCLHANERGDGLLFAAIHRHGFLLNVTPKDGEWYTWTGIVWSRDEKRAAQAACEEVALEYETQALTIRDTIKEKGITRDNKQHPDHYLYSRAKDFEERAKRMRSENGVKKCLYWAPIVSPDMAVRESDFDKCPWLLPCANGVINLKTGVLESGRPQDLLTRAIEIEYHPHAPYVRWQGFVDEISNSDALAAFLKRSFGYAITGHSFEQYIWIFTGPGRNGKGTMFDLIGDILGPYYHEISRAMLLEQRNEQSPSATSEHKYSLLGKRIIVGAETNQGQKIDASAIKSLTGEDRINCRPLFKAEIVFKPTHSLFLQTNHIPAGLTKDFALVQRLFKIDFPFMYVDDVEAEGKKYPPQKHLFRKKDIHLKDELRKEKEGILAWLVQGCREWQEVGLMPPASVTDAVNSLAKDEDYVGQFVADCLTSLEEDYHRDSRISCTRMYEAFRWWWSMNQDSRENRTPSMKGVNKTLKERGHRVENVGGKTWIYRFMINTFVESDIDDFIKKVGNKS